MQHADPDFAEFARNGSGEAFGRLVSRHVAAVHSGARRMLGGRADAAADVAQAVFIQLARRAASLPEDLVVSAWLHRQTVRAALNILRSETRRATREQTAADLMLMNAHDSSTADAELRPHIDRAIAQLPDIDQRALTLRFFDHCELQEIGERLGMSAGAVQKRLARAVEKLRTVLARRGVSQSVAVLALWLSENSVQAVSPRLTASIIAGSLPHAGAGAGVLSSIFTFMANIKSLSAGAVLGLLSGGAWVAWQNIDDTQPHAHALVPANPPESSLAGLARVPGTAATAEDLFGQLLDLTSDPDNEITRQRLAVWVARVPEELWGPLFLVADERFSVTERRRWLPDLARQWARQNPAAAIPLLAGRREGSLLAATGFRCWHETAPDEARRWFVEHQDEAALAKALPAMVSVVAESLAGNSDEAALRWASQLQGNDLRTAALKPLFAKAEAGAGAEGWTQLCGKLLSGEDAEFNAFALRKALEKWTNKSERFKEADQWLASLPPGSKTSLVADAILSEAVMHAGSVPPENALALLLASGPQAASEATARLIKQSPDIGIYARDWMLPLLTGSDREPAILSAARQMVVGKKRWGSGRPFHGEAIAWAAELSDTSVRDPLIYGLYRQWLQYQQERRQSDYAGKWVEMTELGPEIKAVMQRARNDFESKTNP